MCPGWRCPQAFLQRAHAPSSLPVGCPLLWARSGQRSLRQAPGVPGFAVTPGLMPPPCPGWTHCPAMGAVARPHPDEAGTIGGGGFPSHEGWWLMCRDGSSDVTNPVSMRWSRTGAQAPPALQISLDLGQGTRTRLGAGAGAGWQKLGMGRAPRFGVEELPAERVGCGPITACPCAMSTCRWHQDEARAEVLQDAPRHLGCGCGAGVHAVTAPNDTC